MADPGASESTRGGPQFIPRPPTWRPGRPAPWATAVGADPPLLDLDDVRRAIPVGRVGRRSPVEDTGASPSAVLVSFYIGPLGGGLPEPSTPPGDDRANGGDPTKGEELYVVLTRRAWGLRTHAGEVSFPGGRCELGESSAQAAVREAWEETSLETDSVELLGELDHLTTVTRRAYIVPQVAALSGVPDLRPSPAEVDRVLEVPVRELLLPDVFTEEQWGDDTAHRPVYFFALHGDTIWGATAAILRQCLSLLVGVDPGSLEDLDPARTAPKGYRLAAGYEDRVV